MAVAVFATKKGWVQCSQECESIDKLVASTLASLAHISLKLFLLKEGSLDGIEIKMQGRDALRSHSGLKHYGTVELSDYRTLVGYRGTRVPMLVSELFLSHEGDFYTYLKPEDEEIEKLMLNLNKLKGKFEIKKDPEGNGYYAQSERTRHFFPGYNPN